MESDISKMELVKTRCKCYYGGRFSEDGRFFPKDGECECGVHKCHIHCGTCGKIMQSSHYGIDGTVYGSKMLEKKWVDIARKEMGW